MNLLYKAITSLSYTEVVYLCMVVTTICFSMLIMMFLTTKNIILSKKEKLLFILTFLTIAIVSLLDMSTSFMETSGNNNLIVLDYIVNFIGFAISPLIPLFLSRITEGDEKTNSKVWVYGSYSIYVIVLAILVGCNALFTVSEGCIYERHPIGFYYYVICHYLAALYLFIKTIILARKFISSTPYLLFILFALLIGGTLVQVIFPTIHATYLVVSIVSIIYYDYFSSLFATMDGLTGLYSHYMFLGQSKDLKDGQVVVVMDIDNFKQVNDTHGHVMGDKCLTQLAKNIQSTYGECGKCFRIGGDEFAVILMPYANLSGLKDDFIEKTKDILNEYNIGISIGHCTFRNGQMPTDVIKIADERMYEEKAKHK